MNTKHILITTLTSLSLAAACLAHNGEVHTGNPIEGKVTSLSDTSMQLATDKGPMTVTFESGTKFEIGMDGEKGDKSLLKKGDFVMVEGTKLSAKEMEASEVMIHPQETSEPANPTNPANPTHSKH